jgi:hypothetical protein
MKWMKIVYTFTGVDILFKSRLPACTLMAEDGFYFPDFLGNFFRGVLRQTPGKPLATWHQFGTKTRRWSGHFLEWRGSRSNGITMG